MQPTIQQPLRLDEDQADRPGGARKLADIVYDQIWRLIARGEFPAGCKLPSEDQLGARFGVSRPIVREALARLREQGYVQSQRGSGSVVIRGEEPGALAFPPIRTLADLLRCYEFRISVETATVALAAERRTDAHLAEIGELLERTESVVKAEAFHLLADVNFSFHRAIAHCTQNPFFLHTLQMMPNFVGRGRIDVAAFGTSGVLERQRQVHREHISIFEAVRDRDATRARAEMERHIALARDFVLERQTINRDTW